MVNCCSFQKKKGLQCSDCGIHVQDVQALLSHQEDCSVSSVRRSWTTTIKALPFTREIIWLGLAFAVLELAFTLAQSIIKNDDKVVSRVSTSIMWGSVCLSLLFTPFLTTRMGQRKSFVCGSGCLLLYGIAVVTLNHTVVAVASVLAGFGLAALWTAQGVLLVQLGRGPGLTTACAVFWCTYKLADVASNALLSFTGNEFTRIVLTCSTIVGVCSIPMCSRVRADVYDVNNDFVADRRFPWWMHCLNETMINSNIFLLMPGMFWCGFLFGFLNAQFLRGEGTGESTHVVLIFAAVVEILVVVPVGKVADHQGPFVVIAIAAVCGGGGLYLVALALMAGDNPFPAWFGQPWPFVIAAILFAVANAIFTTQMWASLGRRFANNPARHEGHVACAFMLLYFFQTWGIAASEIPSWLEPSFDLRNDAQDPNLTQLYVHTGALVLACGCFALAEYYGKRAQRFYRPIGSVEDSLFDASKFQETYETALGGYS